MARLDKRHKWIEIKRDKNQYGDDIIYYQCSACGKKQKYEFFTLKSFTPVMKKYWVPAMKKYLMEPIELDLWRKK